MLQLIVLLESANRARLLELVVYISDCISNSIWLILCLFCADSAESCIRFISFAVGNVQTSENTHFLVSFQLFAESERHSIIWCKISHWNRIVNRKKDICDKSHWSGMATVSTAAWAGPQTMWMSELQKRPTSWMKNKHEFTLCSWRIVMWNKEMKENAFMFLSLSACCASMRFLSLFCNCSGLRSQEKTLKGAVVILASDFLRVSIAMAPRHPFFRGQHVRGHRRWTMCCTFRIHSMSQYLLQYSRCLPLLRRCVLTGRVETAGALSGCFDFCLLLLSCLFVHCACLVFLYSGLSERACVKIAFHWRNEFHFE